jgi:hypothetical protein
MEDPRVKEQVNKYIPANNSYKELNSSKREAY